MGDEQEFIRIVDWEDFLHPDPSRRAKPPLAWVKLQTDHLDRLGYLSPSEYGTYNRLVTLAASTNNRIPTRSGYVQRRGNVRLSTVKTLSNLGLIEFFTDARSAKKSQENQDDLEITASKVRANSQQNGHVEERDRTREDRTRHGQRLRAPASVLKNMNTPSPGLDDRPFDEIKDSVYAMAIKLETSDPLQIHRLAGQSLRITPKQCEAAVKQLIEDRQL